MLAYAVKYHYRVVDRVAKQRKERGNKERVHLSSGNMREDGEKSRRNDEVVYENCDDYEPVAPRRNRTRNLAECDRDVKSNSKRNCKDSPECFRLELVSKRRTDGIKRQFSYLGAILRQR